MASAAGVESHAPSAPPMVVGMTSPRRATNDFRRVDQGMSDGEIFSKELKITNAIVDHPRKVMCCCTAFFLLCCVLSFGVLGISLSQAELRVVNHITSLRNDAVMLLQEQLTLQLNDLRAQNASHAGGADGESDRPEDLLRAGASFAQIYLMFVDRGGGNIMTVDRLRYIKSVEDKILYSDSWKHFCSVQWWPAGSGCPGPACPWYINKWDVTSDHPILDGSRVICAPPILSVTYFLWNLRLVTYPSMEECDVEADYDRCVSAPDVAFAFLSQINNTKTAAEKLQDRERGGVEPTERQVQAFAQASARLVQASERWAVLAFFFDGTYNDTSRPVDDPLRYRSVITRSSYKLGGPVSREDPLGQGATPCHARATAVECGSGICVWDAYAGFHRNMTGCRLRQYKHVLQMVPSSWRAVINAPNKDQETAVKDWYLSPLSEDFDAEDNGDVELLYYMTGILWEKILSIIFRDVLLAAISFVFVYLYLQVHTESFFLATMGMFQVIMPFPIGYFVYRGIFQVDFFGTLSVLTLFIVLAIGADDIFVLMDKWVQTDIRPRSDNVVYLRGRMAVAWKDAGSAMGITSLTTMAAFLATAASPLMEIQTFGIFASILVFLDYVLVMTFFAASVVVYHEKYEHTVGCCMLGTNCCGRWCNCCTCYTQLVASEDVATKHGGVGFMQSTRVQPPTFKTLEEAKETLGPELDRQAAALRATTLLPVLPTGGNVVQVHPATSGATAHADPDLRSIETDPDFRRRQLAGRVLLVLAALVLLVAFILLRMSRSDGVEFQRQVTVGLLGLALFCGGMNALFAAKARKRDLGGGALDVYRDNFLTQHLAPFLAGAHANRQVNHVRYVGPVVLLGLLIFFITCAVQLTHTDQSDEILPTWHPVQRIMLLSARFPASTEEYTDRVSVLFGVDEQEPSLRGHLGTWSQALGDINYAPTDSGELTTEAFQEFVVGFCTATLAKSNQGAKLQRTFLTAHKGQTPVSGSGDQNCFMTAFADWVRAKNATFPVPQADYVSRLYEFTVEQAAFTRAGNYIPPYAVAHDKVLWRHGNGKDAPPTGVAAVLLFFNTTLNLFGEANGEYRSWYETWEDWMDAVGAGEPDFVKNAYPDGSPLGSMTVWAAPGFDKMIAQEVLVSGAVGGTFMSLGLATLVIFIGTANVLMAAIVLVDLIGVVGFTLGVVQLAGWQLGLIESVAITILVGLSVDYVVHFATHYSHCDVDVDGEAEAGMPRERQRRVAEVVQSMGPTVLGGAATSIGASLVLLCTWIQIFNKFGVTFLLTILFSYVWAMFFFLPILSVIGPEGDCASLKPLCRRLVVVVKAKKQ
eukprot:TRINITY_DN6160_c0_g1_i1.p1 TRINITY_DN6160_c0_g1~~TRINITY_DN6160_c0_g1_i1.p1  ORF type:complete len:1323 (+),score=394.51 TRINITY_DN6160_c0_g1_i1:140-4108(+)